MSSNYGRGYLGFKASIDAVADCLGGEHVRAAVGHEFADWVYREIGRRSGDRFPSYGGSVWTQATEDDFDRAAELGRNQFTMRHTKPIISSAPWRAGATLVLRGDAMYLEAHETQMHLGSISHRGEYDHRKRETVEKWNASIHDNAMRVLNEKDSTSTYGLTAMSVGSQTGIGNIRSEEAAVKSLIKLFTNFFRVEFSKPVHVANELTPA